MSELPELPEGMFWSAGIYAGVAPWVDVYLNLNDSIADMNRNGAPCYSQRRELSPDWTEDGLAFAIIDAAHSIMARVHGEVARRDMVKRVSTRLGGMPIMGAGV